MRVDNQDVGLEAAIIQRVRNSSLVERDPAPTTYRGSSLAPKLRNMVSVVSCRVVCGL